MDADCSSPPISSQARAPLPEHHSACGASGWHKRALGRVFAIRKQQTTPRLSADTQTARHKGKGSTKGNGPTRKKAKGLHRQLPSRACRGRSLGFEMAGHEPPDTSCESHHARRENEYGSLGDQAHDGAKNAECFGKSPLIAVP